MHVVMKKGIFKNSEAELLNSEGLASQISRIKNNFVIKKNSLMIQLMPYVGFERKYSQI